MKIYVACSSIKKLKIRHCTILYSTSDCIKVHSIRTPVAHRHRGEARTALTALLKLADDLGKAVVLDASPLDDKTSTRRLIEFYESFGFTPTGKRINAVGDIEMKRMPS